jgi:hypothetical protein
MMILTPRNDQKAQINGLFPAGNPRKSMEKRSSTAGRKIVELSRRLLTVSHQKVTRPGILLP